MYTQLAPGVSDGARLGAPVAGGQDGLCVCLTLHIEGQVWTMLAVCFKHIYLKTSDVSIYLFV